jgi:hypothetical protein
MAEPFKTERQFLIAFLKAAVEYDTLVCEERSWVDKIVFELERVDGMVDVWNDIGLVNMSRIFTDREYFEAVKINHRFIDECAHGETT